MKNENQENLKKYIENQKTEIEHLVQEIDANKIIKTIEKIIQTTEKDGEIYTIGNGGSASTAKHFAADLDKTANEKTSHEINSRSLVSNEPLITAWTNDENWDEVYIEQLRGRIKDKDLLIAFSVHGGSGPWSGNLSKALNFANKQNADTIGIAGFDGGEFSELCDHTIIVEKDSTPQVESLHVIIHHLIAFGIINEI